jgi:hypothetical protein
LREYDYVKKDKKVLGESIRSELKLNDQMGTLLRIHYAVSTSTPQEALPRS